MDIVIPPFQFISYADTVSRLLSAFGIVATTISKIQSRINDGEIGPFYVYRRAAIFCTDAENVDELINSVKMGVPLVIVLQPHNIIVYNQENCQTKREVDYEDINLISDILKPLQSWDITRNDRYKTLELDQLVASLYRTLKLSDNEEDTIRNFIFSMLYISHFDTLFEDEETNNIISSYLYDDADKLKKVFDKYQGWKLDIIKKPATSLDITKEAYRYIFAILRFDTSLVDAEILTSLIYKMAQPEETGLYGHQTNFENVAKLLQPLFLSSMQMKAENSTTENVFAVVQDIYDTKIFDPTNGPGCFLVSAYIGLTQQLRDIETKFNIKCERSLSLGNFIGLVSNSLCLSLTKLALIFTHSKELKYNSILDKDSLKSAIASLNISVGNELLSDWHDFVAPDDNVYIVGSPEFRGYNRIPAQDKSAMHKVFNSDSINSADYSSSWLVKSAQFISGTNAKAAFVLTNSVSQGAQAPFILNKINSFDVEYIFAHRSFKWKTSGSDNAGVTVVIIGLGTAGLSTDKLVFDNNIIIHCQKIGPNLLPDIDIRIKRRTKPLSKLLPTMRKGNMPDGAIPLTFSSEEIDDFLNKYPEAEKFVRPLYGGDEFVSGKPRWVLWISDDEVEDAMNIAGCAERIEKVRDIRCKPSSTSSQKSKSNPHKFRETFCSKPGNITLVVPCVTSEHRDYFQIGILEADAIVNNNVNVIFDSPIWLLALLESRIHLVWALNVCGGHETRPRYSSSFCYHTFPIPELSKKQIGVLTSLSKTLLEVREKYCNKSLAELYNDLPPELIRVHSWIDDTVDSFYRDQPFDSDTERLHWLWNLYNQQINNE